MHRKKGDKTDKPLNLRGGVMVYPDGSISVDPEVILRQYRQQFKSSARSNLEEDEWQKQLDG